MLRRCALLASRHVIQRHKATSAAVPFHYEDIIQQETPLQTPWKKLTGKVIA